MDRCEALAAAYGQSPFVVLAWSWVKVEILWQSYMKRLSREWKVQALLRGATFEEEGDIPALPPGSNGSARDPTIADGFAEHPQPWYGNNAVYHRRPTDKDSWEIPQHELSKLAMLFPGAVKQVKSE